MESWAGADADYGRALAFTPASFMWIRSKALLVELPALWARIPLQGRDPHELAATVIDLLAAENAPTPNYLLAGGGQLAVVYRIKPLLRPAAAKPPQHHQAFAGALEAWRRAAIKLSLALKPLGCLTLNAALVDDLLLDFLPLPLDPASPLQKFMGLHDDVPSHVGGDAGDALLIADVSKPLRRFDAAMFKILGIDPPNGRKRWLSTPTSITAAMPQSAGERHNAAVKIACAARWDGEDEDQIYARLIAWAPTCAQHPEFPKRRRSSDELKDIAVWAASKLEPGGPTRGRDGVRVKRQTSVDAVAAATVKFLSSIGGVYEGAKHELAKQVALWRTENREAGCCPLRTLKRSIAALKAAGDLLHDVERVGRTWNSTWRLPPGNSPDGETSTSRGQKEESIWSPPPGGFHSEEGAGGRLPPAGGVEGGAVSAFSPKIGAGEPDRSDQKATSEPNNEASENPSPENSRRRKRKPSAAAAQPNSESEIEPGASPARRPRQRRWTTVGIRQTKLDGTRGRKRTSARLPVITSELAAELADLAPSLTAQQRHDLLLRAKAGLRPRPSVLADFAAALRKRAERLRRQDILEQMQQPPQQQQEVQRPLPAAPPSPPRRLQIVLTPLHLRSVQDRSRLLHDQGLSLLPLKPATKVPAIPEWRSHQSVAMSSSSLRRLLEQIGDDAGLAVICGRCSDIVVADLDDDEAVAWAHKNLPPTPWRTKTRRGEHWYFRMPTTWAPPEGVPWLGSIQAEGRYVVAPGSKHPETGEVYEALGDWSQPRLKLPVFEVRWLTDVAALRAARAAILKGD